MQQHQPPASPQPSTNAPPKMVARTRTDLEGGIENVARRVVPFLDWHSAHPSETPDSPIQAGFREIHCAQAHLIEGIYLELYTENETHWVFRITETLGVVPGEPFDASKPVTTRIVFDDGLFNGSYRWPATPEQAWGRFEALCAYFFDVVEHLSEPAYTTPPPPPKQDAWGDAEWLMRQLPAFSGPRSILRIVAVGEVRADLLGEMGALVSVVCKSFGDNYFASITLGTRNPRNKISCISATSPESIHAALLDFAHDAAQAMCGMDALERAKEKEKGAEAPSDATPPAPPSAIFRR